MCGAENNILLANTSNNDEPIDLLSRQEFIDQLIHISESLSLNKENACYAINGEWGVGKTFILEAFEKNVSLRGQEGTLLSKFLAFHYNCWQYDFYEEPLIAMVAAILDQIDEKIRLIPLDKREHIIAALKAIGISLLEKATTIFKENTGIDPKEITKVIKESDKAASKEIAKSHDYDFYFNFKKTLKELSKTIENLAHEQTVILIVDEMDRCLPEYTVKVLERLHHVFDGIPNVQVILAVDRRQLENTIKRIYGEAISTRRYLAKFIDFEINLPFGKISNQLEVVYSNYFSNFTYDISSKVEAHEVYTTILSGIDIRTRKKIIEKSHLCHRLLNPQSEKCDIAVLCIEVFFTLLKEYDLNIAFAKTYFDINALFTIPPAENNQIFLSTTHVLPGLEMLSKKYKKERKRYFSNGGSTCITLCDIWGLLLGIYRAILGFAGDVWDAGRLGRICIGDSGLIEYALKYWEFIKILN